MTTITPDDAACVRCNHNLLDAAERHMESGGPDQCPRCGLGFDLDDSWIVSNGYERTHCEHCPTTPLSWDDDTPYCPSCGRDA